MADFIAYAKPAVDRATIVDVEETLRSGLFTGGPKVAAFETAFSELCEGAHSISCSSGTSALFLIAQAMRVDDTVAVIVPSVTFLATASAFAMLGAEVVLADVDPVSGLMSEQYAADAIARATKPVAAIIAVHLGGRIADLPGLRAIADRCGARLVEDACHAVGSVAAFGNDRSAVGACRYSFASTFSFHPTKTISTAEGGMVTTRDEGFAQSLALFRNHGINRDAPFERPDLALDAETGEPNPWFYELREPGLNFRLSDIHAAIGLGQLRHLPEIAETRARIRGVYEEQVCSVRHCQPAAGPRSADLVDHLYQVAIDFEALGASRREVMLALRERGVGTQVHYTPLHLQGAYARRSPDLCLKGAEGFYQGTLSLPLHHSMSEEDAHRVMSQLRAVCGEAL